jgi:hypothetical protein
MTRLRRQAMTCGAPPVRTWEASSAKVTSRMWATPRSTTAPSQVGRQARVSPPGVQAGHAVLDCGPRLEPSRSVVCRRRRCCVGPTQGRLKANLLGSDRQDQFVECDRHAPVGGLLHRQLVVSAPKVLHEGVSGDDHPGTAVLFAPGIGPSRASSLPWSLSTRWLAYRSVRCQAANSRSSNTPPGTPAPGR